jgi:hypothetical protein
MRKPKWRKQKTDDGVRHYVCLGCERKCRISGVPKPTICLVEATERWEAEQD